MSAEAHAHAEEHHDAAPAHGHDDHAPAAHSAPAHGAHGHEAANDNKEHGAAHGAHGPKAANDNKEHAPAHATHGDAHGEHKAHAKTEHGAHPATRGKSPIIAFRDSIFEISNSLATTTSEFGAKINTALRSGDLPAVEKQSLIETPFYAAGHVIDGAVLNVGRRGMEVLSPALSTIRSFISTTVGTILKPSNLTNGEAKKHVGETVASLGKFFKNAIMAIPRALNDIADRGIDRTIQQISPQIERIPVVGRITSPFKWISSGIKQAVAAVTNIADIITSPLGGRSMSAPAAAHDAHGDAHGHDAHAAHAHH